MEISYSNYGWGKPQLNSLIIDLEGKITTTNDKEKPQRVGCIESKLWMKKFIPRLNRLQSKAASKFKVVEEQGSMDRGTYVFKLAATGLIINKSGDQRMHIVDPDVRWLSDQSTILQQIIALHRLKSFANATFSMQRNNWIVTSPNHTKQTFDSEGQLIEEDRCKNCGQPLD